MKKLTKFLVIALMLSLLACAFAFVAGAEESDPNAAPFEVKGVSYNTWAEAYDAAGPGDTIAMTNNYTFLDTDYAEDITHFAYHVVVDSGKTTINQGSITLTTTNNVTGIRIDKKITLHLGGFTLTSAKTSGVVFYVNQYEDDFFTITGSGKISSSIPALVISCGEVVINGGAGDGMTFEYTGEKVDSHIQVGNLTRKITNSSGADQGVTGIKATLSISGNVNFNSTIANYIYTSDGVKTDVAVNATATDRSYNVNWNTAIAVGVNHRLYIDGANIHNTSLSSARTLVLYHPAGNYVNNVNTIIDIKNSYIEQGTNAPVVSGGNAQSEGYTRRANVYVSDSTIKSNATTAVTAMFQPGRFWTNASAMHFEATSSKFITSGSAIIGMVSNNPSSHGMHSAAKFYDCYLGVNGSGSCARGGVSCIFEESVLYTSGSKQVDNGVPWIYKDDPNFSTSVATITGNAAMTATGGVVDALGGYGYLIKAGCSVKSTSQLTDYHGSSGAVPGQVVYSSGTTISSYSFAYEENTVRVSTTVYNKNGAYITAYQVLKDSDDVINYVVCKDLNSSSLTAGTVYGGDGDDKENITSDLTLSSGSGNKGSASLIFATSGKARQGEYTVYQDENGNKYISYKKYRDSSATSAPYFHITYASHYITSSAYKENGAYVGYKDQALDKFRYYSFDFDLMTPTGKLDNNIKITPYYYVSVSAQSDKVGANTGALTLVQNNDGTAYWTHENTSGKTTTFTTNKGEWHHFSVIYEINTGDVDGVNQITSTRLYVYCDGELIGSFDKALKDAHVTATNSAGLKYALMGHLRFDLPTRTTAGGSTGEETAFDNFELARYATGATLDAADIVNNTYSKADDRTAGYNGHQPIAVDGTYFDVQAEAEKNIVYNSVISLNDDFDGVFAPEFPVVVETNGYSFSYDVDPLKIVAETNGETLSFRWATPEDIDAIDYILTVDGVESYESGTLDNVIAMAQNGTVSVIKLLDNIVYESSATVTISKDVTIDLNGFTLSIVQTREKTEDFLITSTAGFTVKSGKIDVTNVYNPSKPLTFPTFKFGAASAKLIMDEVIAYSGHLIYNTDKKNPIVEITNSEFHGVRQAGNTIGGIIESRANITVTAENSKFYLVDQMLFASLSYNAGSNASSISSSFTYTNCDIYTQTPTKQIINSLNTFTQVEFNGCNISGSLVPLFNTFDSNYGNKLGVAATAENILLGEGTTLASGSTYRAITPTGYALVPNSESYTFTATGVSKTYTKGYVVGISTEDPSFIIIKDETETEVVGDFFTAYNMASDGATVKFLEDLTEIQLSQYHEIDKNITFDLNEKELVVEFLAQKDVGFRLAKKGINVKFYNGTVKAFYINETTAQFPLFNYSQPGTYIFDSVKSYTGGLVYNYTQTGVGVEFVGGEHHIVRAAESTSGGFVDTRGNATVTANGTSFYCVDVAVPFNMSSYKTTSVAKVNTLTFTDCNIYNTSIGVQVLTMNSNTTATFNNCVIRGKLSPERNSIESSSATNPIDGSVVLGAGTVVASNSISSAVRSADGLVFAYEPNTITLTFDTYSQGVITENNTKTVETFCKVASQPGNAAYLTTIKDVECYIPDTFDFGEVIALVSANSTIKLIDDVTYELGAQLVIDKVLTVNLNGHTLNVVETLEKDIYFSLKANGAITFMGDETLGGNLVVTNTATTVYPLFYMSSANVELVLDNLDVTSGPLIYNNTQDDPTVTIRDCEFNVIYKTGNTLGGVVESRDNITVNAYDSKFYLNGNNTLIGSLHYNASTGDTYLSSFTFTNCDIYREGITNTIITSINNYTQLYFNGCNIHGALTLERHSYDKTAGNSANVGATEASAANVHLGENTKVARGASIPAVVDSGFNKFYYGDNHTFEIFAKEAVEYEIGYTITTDVARFLTTIGSNEVYLTDDYELDRAIEITDSGSTLHVLENLEIVTNSNPDANTVKYYANINKPLVLDLNGNTIYVSQSTKVGSTIKIDTDSAVTIRNGTFVWNVNSTYINNYASDGLTEAADSGKSFALFNVTKNNAKVTFEDVNTYGSTLIYSYNSTGVQVSFDGGEYHIYEAVSLIGGGIAEFRANVTITAEDAIFYMDGGHLMTLASYQDQSGTKSSTATFTRCAILGPNESYNLLRYLNSYGRVYFNECLLHGSIKPSVNTTDKTSLDPVNGSIVLGNGTYLMKDATLKEGIVVAEGGRAIVSANRNVQFDVTIANGSIYDPENPTFTLSTASKSYVYTLVVGEPPLKTYYITWYQEDGVTVIERVPVLEGTVGVVAPTYTPGGSNGWYMVGFDGWTTTYGGSEKVDLLTYVVTGNAGFYPAEAQSEAPKAYLTGAQFNLSLSSTIKLNFYLPAAPSGVSNIVVKDSLGNEITGKGVIIPSGAYYKLYELGEVRATELDTTFVITVDFTVDGVALKQTITLSPYKYVTLILEDSEKATQSYSTESHTLIADMVRYSNLLGYALTGNTNAKFDSLLETYGDLCTDLPSSNDFGHMESTLSGLSDYVKSITFEVTNYEPRWVIAFDSSKKVTDVTITVNGYYDIPDENGVNFGEITYVIDNNMSVYEGNYITKAYMENMPVYNIDKVITITVTTEGGAKASAEYSLNTYYSYMDATGTDLYNYQMFLRAFRAFGDSSALFKYPSGVIEEEAPTVDFFDCNHDSALTKTWNVNNGRYCNTCATYVFFYQDYINAATWGGAAYGSRDEAIAGGVNSYSAIHACHYYANIKSNNYKVGCVSGSFTYYLSAPLDKDGNIGEINTRTDTDWEGTYFIVDDTGYQIGSTEYSTRVFGIRGNGEVAPDGTSYGNAGKIITSTLATNSGVSNGSIIVKKGATKLDFAPGMPMMIELKDASVKHYIRTGGNANEGDDQSELILIDEFGNISNTTPVEWDYTYSSSFKAVAYPITDEPIKYSGLDSNGEISCTFENITWDGVDVSKYSACSRAILVRRSNVTIEGIDRVFTEDNTKTTPRQAYYGFIYVWYANNTLIKDMLVMNHLGHYIINSDGSEGASLGSYEFAGQDSINTTWENCISKNFFNSDGSITYRGLFGTNRMKNMYLKNCILNSFDAHTGAYNVTIEDSTFEHINFIGAGDIRLDNVTIYTAKNYKMALNLRDDYGSTWNGDLYMNNIAVRYSKSNAPTYIDLIRASYANSYYGYTTYLPQNIYIDGIRTEAYTRSTPAYSYANGQIVEKIDATNAIPLGIYQNLNSAYTNDYDYSTTNENNKNPRTCTQNIYLNNLNGLSITYPDHPFFKNMKVYIDGVEKTNWYSERDFGGGCLVEGTLITMADGTQKPIEEVTPDDEILVYNHETGEYEAGKLWFTVHGDLAREERTVINLVFSDDTVVRIVHEHALFNSTLAKYVYLSAENYSDYIGDEFLGVNGKVTLVDAYTTRENVKVYSPISELHLNVIAEGMITATTSLFNLNEMINAYEYDENGVYLADKRIEDLMEYGVYEYSEFAHLFSENEYNTSPLRYLKVAVGKGLITREDIETLIKTCVALGYMEAP